MEGNRQSSHTTASKTHSPPIKTQEHEEEFSTSNLQIDSSYEIVKSEEEDEEEEEVAAIIEDAQKIMSQEHIPVIKVEEKIDEIGIGDFNVQLEELSINSIDSIDAANQEFENGYRIIKREEVKEKDKDEDEFTGNRKAQGSGPKTIEKEGGTGIGPGTGYGQGSGPKTIETIEREVRVRTTIKRIINVDMIKQTCTMDFFIEGSWEAEDHPAFRMDSVEIDEDETKWSMGKLRLKGEETDFFCPMLFVSNIKEKLEFEEWGTISESTTKFGSKDRDKLPIVYYRMKATAVLTQNMHFEDFPVDTQTLGITLCR